MTKSDANDIKAWLASIFLLLTIHAENLNVPYWVSILPIVSRYLFEIVAALLEAATHANEWKGRVSAPDTKPIHWNPKTKSMFEDVEFTSDYEDEE